ncbi:MAG: polysaccharide (de)acetylase [Proteobacteria bacterium]|nr:polysaccharide (de)acetylase [Pseudomonadota bacterium]
MPSTLKNRVLRNLSNLPGWCTSRKIVVIESDDWGSIRMPSRKVFDTLSKAGLDLKSGDSLRYNLYDSLATSGDLSALFETISSVKDKNGRSCVFTAISLVANPDFEKIKDSCFQEYFYEPFTQTLKRYPGCEKSFSLWQEGIQRGLFMPQFHGREHLNATAWMRSLQAGHWDTCLAFEYGMWGFKTQREDNIPVTFQAAFDIGDLIEIPFQKTVIKEGLSLFNRLFGYPASFFVPPNGPLNRQLEKTAAENGISYIATSKIQREPLGKGKTQKNLHWLGQKNRCGQYYLTRNCFFEPSQEGRDWVNACLNDIRIAFRWNKPAVISSHRVNYVGAIDQKNRDRGLKDLKTLLAQIMKKWPDVEFMTSVQLGDCLSI